MTLQLKQAVVKDLDYTRIKGLTQDDYDDGDWTINVTLDDGKVYREVRRFLNLNVPKDIPIDDRLYDVIEDLMEMQVSADVVYRTAKHMSFIVSQEQL